MLRSRTMAEQGGRVAVDVAGGQPGSLAQRSRVRLALCGLACISLVVLLGFAVGPRSSDPDRDLKRVLREPIDERHYRRTVRLLASETRWPHASYALALLPVAVAAALLVREVWLLRRPADRWRWRWRWLLPALAVLPLQHALRVAFWRAGPRVPLWSEGDRGAYPSGAAVAVALGWAVGTVVVGDLRPRWRPAAATAAVVALSLHAAARITTQKHWATDILGSYLLVAGVLLLAAACAPAARRR
jgi:membrane-associated phospholipid phosphatase